MKRFIACAILLLFAAPELLAQGSAVGKLFPSGQSSPTPAQKQASKPAEQEPARSADKDPVKAAVGGNRPTPAGQPVTTEIYADEAFFDSEKYIGTFTRHVIVNDPRFNIQADKLTVYLGQGEDKGLDRAVAEGNVAVVRDRPGEGGKPPVRSVGRAEKAVYTAKDGNVELSGTPRVQSGLNTHVAMSPDTVMLINESGQLTTRGPSRTEIRQEPKAEVAPKP
ncbi:MAG: LptA/OstA family protein [Chthoniobacterales bacterium]